MYECRKSNWIPKGAICHTSVMCRSLILVNVNRSCVHKTFCWTDFKNLYADTVKIHLVFYYNEILANNNLFLSSEISYLLIPPSPVMASKQQLRI